MKPAITITTTILASMLTAGFASAQSPAIIQNTRATMNGVRDNAAAASNEALGMNQPAPSAASATHAAPKASAPPTIAAGAKIAMRPKNTGGAKRVAAVGVRHGAHPKAVATTATPKPAPKANGPVEANVVGGAAAVEGQNSASEQTAAPDSKYSANGRRDPFISPVVSRAASGSGCSTGKKCLEIGTISLRGVVHQESGFIAVVSNGLNKAYFLRENDPVFNGYVMKITGDSIVFQETLQDRLGKSFTREVVKKITTPAV
jgi:hypothetical protein